jgi:hypothetical protein
MNKFEELRKIDVTDRIKKKGSLNYLSWAYAVDVLLMNDPNATWEFHPPIYYGDTVMVSCSVHAFGKIMNMQLAVMDNRGNAVKQPDARKISDAQMRVLTKCIACFGVGLFIYQNEDIPPEDQEDPADEVTAYIDKIKNTTTPDDLRTVFQESYLKFKKFKSLANQLKDAYDIKKGSFNATS